MLHKAESRTATTKTVRETEAEAVAFVVRKAVGLVTGTASADSFGVEQSFNDFKSHPDPLPLSVRFPLACCAAEAAPTCSLPFEPTA
jgi:hypothetical protein